MSFSAKDYLGPGQIGAMRPVAYKATYDGKLPFLVGTFSISKDASEAEINAKANSDIAAFIRDHFPDGTPVPALLEVKPGALRWIPDDDYFRRGR